MWKNKKIPAFTIAELMVVLVLSAIVFSMAYSAFFIAQKTFADFQQKGIITENLDDLNTQIYTDFNQASRVLGRHNKLTLQSDSSAIYYTYQRELIVREQFFRKDTFWFKTSDLRFYFEGEEPARFNSLIDELFFTCIVGERSINFHLRKEYPAQVLLNNLHFE